MQTWRQDTEQSRLQFLRAELDLSLTFAKIARGAGEPDSAARNRANALKGLETILQLLQNITVLGQEYREEVNGKLAELRQRLGLPPGAPV